MKKSRFYYSIPCYKTEVGLVDTPEGPVIFNIGGKITPLPRITICGSLDTEANTLSFGAAVCSPKDRFERKIGREIAEKRALECPMIVVPVTKENTPDVFIEVASELEVMISEMKNLNHLNGEKICTK